MARRLSEGLERLKQNALSPGDVLADLEKTNLDALSPGNVFADVVVVCGEDVHRLHSALLASKAARKSLRVCLMLLTASILKSSKPRLMRWSRTFWTRTTC